MLLSRDVAGYVSVVSVKGGWSPVDLRRCKQRLYGLLTGSPDFVPQYTAPQLSSTCLVP
jgi:hypothetical protein